MPRLPAALQDHFDAPRNVGPPADGHELRGEARNAACGDHYVVFLGLEEGRVARAGFKAMGCPPFLAMASAATELLPGLAPDAGLPGAVRARYEDRYGPLPRLHGHALALIEEALRGVAPDPVGPKDRAVREDAAP